MIPLESARARVFAGCAPLRPRAIPLADALRCVTSVDLVCEEEVPPFANTAMDGFAVRAADTAGAPVRLRIVDTLAAGAAPGRSVGEGEAIRIMTGAPMPPGADAVVMVERTSVDGDDIVIEQAATAGDHIRAAGSDLQPGQTLFPAGTELSPAHLGVLASLGYRNVPVFPRARVGVLSTGDELVEHGELRPGQIRDSNRPMLLALLAETNCVPVDLGLARDDEAVIEAAIEQAVAECDALVTSGGVSMGDFDYVKVVLDRMGAMQWMQVAIKPAKPLAVGLVQDTPVFGLPGNPVSSLVSFELFARPALRLMMGHGERDRPRLRAVAGEPLRRRPDGKTHFARVVARYEDGELVVRSAGGQGSHQLGAMAAANALAVLPDGDGVDAGGRVEVIPLGVA